MKDAGEAFELLRPLGFKSAAMALRKDALPLDDERIKNEKKLILLLGNEGAGLKSETVEACDYTVVIPMRNEVDSLNVAAAAAVAFWELRKGREKE